MGLPYPSCRPGGRSRRPTLSLTASWEDSCRSSRAFLLSLSMCLALLGSAAGMDQNPTASSHTQSNKGGTENMGVALRSQDLSHGDGADKRQWPCEDQAPQVQDKMLQERTEPPLPGGSCSCTSHARHSALDETSSGNTTPNSNVAAKLTSTLHRRSPATSYPKKEEEADRAASSSRRSSPSVDDNTGGATNLYDNVNRRKNDAGAGHARTRPWSKVPSGSIRPSTPELRPGVTRRDLERRANKPQIYGYPFERSYIFPCGKLKLSTLLGATHAEMRDRPETTPLQRMRIQYQQHAQRPSVEASQTFKSMRTKPDRGSYRVTFMTWNAELILPEPLEIILPFARTSAHRLSIDEQDVVLIVLQESLRLTRDVQARFLEQTLRGLNGLSRVKNWVAGDPVALFLPNLIGTKFVLKKPLTTNTQGLVWFKRSSAPVQKVKSCRHSIYASEKGFVGTVLEFAGAGTALFAGLHLSTTEAAPQLDKLLYALDSKCDRGGQGSATSLVYAGAEKAYFRGGVFVAGDFNSRLSPSAVEDALTALEGSTDHQAMVSPTPEDTTSVQRLMRLFAPEGKEASPKDFEETRGAVFWSVDTMGGAPVEPAKDIRKVLVDHNFVHVSTCYEGGFTYDYQKSCTPDDVSSPMSPLEVMKQCLSSRALSDPRQVGFLDRLVIRHPESGSSLTQRKYPPVVSVLRNAMQVLNFRSDHGMQVWDLQLFYETNESTFLEKLRRGGGMLRKWGKTSDKSTRRDK